MRRARRFDGVPILLLFLGACGGGGGGDVTPAGGARLVGVKLVPVGSCYATGVLSPAFSPETLAYVVGPASLAPAVRVIPTAQDPGSTLLVNGQAVVSGAMSEVLPLAIGTTMVSILVTAADSTRTYAIEFDRFARPVISPTQVSKFSPDVSPIDFGLGRQDPVFVDAHLLSSTDPAYPGQLVAFFTPGTVLDPTSIFVGGIPALGLDVSAVQVLRHVPGTGMVLVPVRSAEVECDRIAITPEGVAPGESGLPEGQYLIGLFTGVRSMEGDPLARATFHSFTVGSMDVVDPVILTSSPASGTQDVDPAAPSVVIRFSESMELSSIHPEAFRVEDVTIPTSPVLLPPLVGRPTLVSAVDGATLPSNGVEVVWSGAAAFPPRSHIRVTIVGLDAEPAGATVPRDLSGNALQVSATFEFVTR